MSREYVSVGFNCQRVSAIVHRSASDKLAFDSLVLLVCGLVLFLQRERERESGKSAKRTSAWQLIISSTVPCVQVAEFVNL